jgi:hypothetical protein
MQQEPRQECEDLPREFVRSPCRFKDSHASFVHAVSNMHDSSAQGAAIASFLLDL